MNKHSAAATNYQIHAHAHSGNLTRLCCAGVPRGRNLAWWRSGWRRLAWHREHRLPTIDLRSIGPLRYSVGMESATQQLFLGELVQQNLKGANEELFERIIRQTCNIVPLSVLSAHRCMNIPVAAERSATVTPSIVSLNRPLNFQKCLSFLLYTFLSSLLFFTLVPTQRVQ